MESLSFRDPDGHVVRHGERILRAVRPGAAERLKRFLSCDPARAWIKDGKLAWTEPAAEADGDGFVYFEHQPIRFPNYPYEWAPEMLHAAAELTLDMAEATAGGSYELKDATPFNVMFEGPRPVFLDVLSFSGDESVEKVWRPYGQFMRTFVYPLLGSRHFGLGLDEVFLPHRDGLEPERMLRLCSPWRALSPTFLSAVTAPALLKGPEAQFRAHPAGSAEESAFLKRSAVRRGRRHLRRARPVKRRGEVIEYMDGGHTYSPEQLELKERFVSGAAASALRVLDLGCNTGHFSLLTASQGRSVVAIDRDAGSAGALWAEARARNLDVLPLVVDIARPPGGSGWENGEAAAFLARARGRFDCVLALALLHHLTAGEGVPLERALDLIADLTTRWAVVEHVDPADEQFRRISRGREALHAHLTEEHFARALERRFDVRESLELTPTRSVYRVEKRASN